MYKYKIKRLEINRTHENLFHLSLAADIYENIQCNSRNVPVTFSSVSSCFMVKKGYLPYTTIFAILSIYSTEEKLEINKMDKCVGVEKIVILLELRIYVQHDDNHSQVFCLVPLKLLTYISNSNSSIQFFSKGFHAIAVIL